MKRAIKYMFETAEGEASFLRDATWTVLLFIAGVGAMLQWVQFSLCSLAAAAFYFLLRLARYGAKEWKFSLLSGAAVCGMLWMGILLFYLLYRIFEFIF